MPTELRFISSNISEVKTEMTVFVNGNDEIFIEIKDPKDDGYFHHNFICLDLETSIRFSKELKKQIALLKGALNG